MNQRNLTYTALPTDLDHPRELNYSLCEKAFNLIKCLFEFNTQHTENTAIIDTNHTAQYPESPFLAHHASASDLNEINQEIKKCQTAQHTMQSSSCHTQEPDIERPDTHKSILKKDIKTKNKQVISLPNNPDLIEYLCYKFDRDSIMRDVADGKIYFLGRDEHEIKQAEYQRIVKRVKAGENPTLYMLGEQKTFTMGYNKKTNSLSQYRMFIPKYKIRASEQQSSAMSDQALLNNENTQNALP